MVFSQCVFRAPETAGFQLWFLLGSVGKAPDSPSLKWLCLSLLLHNSTYSVQFSRSVVSDSLWPPWTAAGQALLSITNSLSLLKLMSIESVMPSNHLILCHPLLLLPSVFTSISFPNVSVIHIRWPKYYSFGLSSSPSNEYSGSV